MLFEVSNLMKYQGFVDRVDACHHLIGVGIEHFEEIALVLDEGRRLQL